MALENLVGPDIFIDNLVRTNPALDDPVSQGDDHLRGIKNSLLNSFPAITGAVTLSQTELNEIPTKYAPLASPAFTGIPTAPTAAPGTNTEQLATTAFVAGAIVDTRVWQDVTGSRASGATYTNNTGRPIQLLVRLSSSSTSVLSAIVQGVSIPAMIATPTPPPLSIIVPAGNSYSVSWTNAALLSFMELR